MDLLDRLRDQIISGVLPDEIKLFREERSNRKSISIYQEQKELISNKINYYLDKYLSHNLKSIIISRISYHSANIVDIDVGIFIDKTDNKKYIYFVGKDLALCFKLLPNYIIRYKNGKVGRVSPFKGTNHSRIYPYIVFEQINEITINLRVLELWARTNSYTPKYYLSETCMLGSAIKVEIPSSFISISDLSDPIQINSQDNPIRINPGIFIFGKNGLSNGRMTQMFNKLFEIKPHFENLVLKFPLVTTDLSRFAVLDKMFVCTSWFGHQRLFIKINKSIDSTLTKYDNLSNHSEEEYDEFVENDEENMEDEDDNIKSIVLTDLESVLVSNQFIIIDPWKRRLDTRIEAKLKEKNPLMDWKFIPRRQKDQDTEGSCSLCVFARLVYLLDTIWPEDSNSPVLTNSSDILKELFYHLEQPIPDFYAYLTKYLYRKSFDN